MDIGIHPTRPRDIIIDHSFVGLYREFLREMMSLIRHIIRASRVLTMMRDAG